MESTNNIPSGWLKKLGQKIYMVSHAKACFYSVSADGEKITVYDKISSLIKCVIPTTASTSTTFDCNTYLDQGTIYIPYTVEALNMPGGSTNGWLKNIPGSGDAIKQIFHRSGTTNKTDNRLYIRTYHKKTKIFSEWSEVLTSTTKWITTYCIKHKSINCAASTVTYPKANTDYTTNYIECKSNAVGIKIMKSGCYLLSARAGFKKPTDGKAGYRQVQVMRRKSSETSYESVVTAVSATSNGEGGVTALNTSSVIRRLNEGDSISIAVKQYSGADKDLSCYYSYLELAYLGA